MLVACLGTMYIPANPWVATVVVIPWNTLDGVNSGLVLSPVMKSQNENNKRVKRIKIALPTTLRIPKSYIALKASPLKRPEMEGVIQDLGQ